MSAKRSKKKGKKQRNAANASAQGRAPAQATARKLESAPPLRAEPVSGMRIASAPATGAHEPTTVEIVGAIVEAIAAPFADAPPATSVPDVDRGSATQKVTAKRAPDGEGREGMADAASTISSQSSSEVSADETPDEDREPLTPRVWEHRTHPRVAIAVDIDLASESHFFSGLSGDVSEGGVFVQTYREIAVGSEVAVEFVLPGGHVSAHGKVRWHRDKSDSSPPGVGIAFDDLSEEDRELIHRFCQARAPLYYDVEHA
jgi:uncharacterized protein (TIGR02266 family)